MGADRLRAGTRHTIGSRAIRLAVAVLAAGLSIGVAIGVAPRAALAQQRVTLRIRPPVGDTLRMVMQQQFDLAPEDSTGAPERPMTGALLVWTRAVVLGRSGTATDLVSITDSVVVQPPSAAALPPLREAKRALEGRTVHMRISEDGELTVARRDGGSLGLGPNMPSVLPQAAVRVGESWTRDLRVPLSTTRNAVALVHTTFRLDSLTEGGAVAYVSMHGDVSHDHADDRGGMTGRTTGTLSGTLQVDRRLAWITDSRMTVALVSTAAPAGKPPTRLHVRIAQQIRALPER